MSGITTSLTTRSKRWVVASAERVAGRGRDDGRAALVAQQLGERLADAEVVVDDQDREPGDRRRAPLAPRRRPAAARGRRRALAEVGHQRAGEVLAGLVLVARARAPAPGSTMAWIFATSRCTASKRSSSMTICSSVAVPADELLEQLHGVGDDLERVVDLVREADGELAEGQRAGRACGSGGGPWRSRSSRPPRRPRRR